MARKNNFNSVVVAAASLAAFAPAAASAQNYGGYSWPGYGYSDRGYYACRYDDRRRDAWAARERWEREEARRYRYPDDRGGDYENGRYHSNKFRADR